MGFRIDSCRCFWDLPDLKRARKRFHTALMGPRLFDVPLCRCDISRALNDLMAAVIFLCRRTGTF